MDRRKKNDYERGSEALAVLHSLLSYGDNLHYEKFSNGSVKCIEDEIPFDIPGSWAWVRISSICVINPKNDLNDDTEVSFIPMPHICEGYENRHSFDIRKWSEIKTGYTHFAENDIGIAKITPCFENRKSVVFHNLKNGAGAGTTELFILRPIISVEPDYLLWIAKTDDFINGGVETFSAAVGQQRVDRDFLVNYLIPLPPVNEQKSIINKINVAFSVINTVDQNKADLANTIFYAKSKILDLAIRGQLVPQDPDDEPASVLLERIRAEKEELIKQGKIKRDKKESVIFRGEDNSYYEKMGDKVENISDEIPFELPDGWMWCRGRSCFSGMESTKPQGEFFDYIDIDAIDNRLHRIKTAKHLPASEAPSRASRAVKTGSVLFSLVRPYLENIALVEKTHSHCIASTGFYVCNSNGILLPKFMFFLMISSYVVSGLNQYMKGDNSPSISKDNIESWLYPVPPMAEQKAICAKLKKVFNLIAKVENSLS